MLFALEWSRKEALTKYPISDWNCFANIKHKWNVSQLTNVDSIIQEIRLPFHSEKTKWMTIFYRPIIDTRRKIQNSMENNFDDFFPCSFRKLSIQVAIDQWSHSNSQWKTLSDSDESEKRERTITLSSVRAPSYDFPILIKWFYLCQK